jgi:hypothetical protein
LKNTGFEPHSPFAGIYFMTEVDHYLSCNSLSLSGYPKTQKCHDKPDVVGWACPPSYWELKENREFQPSLGYIARPCLETNKTPTMML